LDDFFSFLDDLDGDLDDFFRFLDDLDGDLDDFFRFLDDLDGDLDDFFRFLDDLDDDDDAELSLADLAATIGLFFRRRRDFLTVFFVALPTDF
jgi:hypothetical protein